MKLIKMSIGRNRTPEKTSYVYPKEYDARKVRFGPVYESSLKKNFDKVVARGDRDESILIGVDDADAVQFLANPTAQEVPYDDALALGDDWTEQVERITDSAKVIAISAKVARGESLSKKEKEALDPESKEPGITKSRSFKEVLDEALAK
ncbi:MAG: hypothetical protein EHM49_00060 [Deltaproteobacteria bacterium]|nr:MAG: hypothetical protein EHM49_00060 [Deltaproteobacteria bacterium]